MYTSDKAVRFFDMGKRLVAKYSDLLEGIQDDYTKAVTAILLENETQWLESMDEATRITNVGSFDKYVYPLIRRTYPSLIVNDLVSVQPLTGPTGLIFYLKFDYGTNKGAVTAGQEYLGGNVAGFDETYSSDTIKNETLVMGDGATVAFPALQSVFFPVRPSSVTITYVKGGVTRTLTDNGSTVISGPGLAAGSIVYAGGAISLTFA